MRPIIVPCIIALALSPRLAAAEAQSEITRQPAPPMAIGQDHTVRQIPEACARIEGRFTGQEQPAYRFRVVQTGPGCSPRARLVNADEVEPDLAEGWILNDVVEIPAAGCPGLRAVATVWRLPATSRLELDAQGRARIYLDESRQAAGTGDVPQGELYAARLRVNGEPCR